MFKSLLPKLLTLCAVISLLLHFSSIFAAEVNKTRQNIAIDGYDVTAYFSEAKPVPGNDNYTVHWKDAIWKFANSDAKELFEANPEKYAPQYGGHCANGMSLDHKVYGDPNIWRIIDDKLYLFFSHNGRNRWANKTEQWIIDADNYWPLVKDE